MARAADETVGLWVKNSSPVPVVVSIDGKEACTLEAPVLAPCVDKITKLTNVKKMCSSNSLKISCITDVPASGADVTLKRADGVAYKVRAGKGGTLYICVEPTALTDCFGTTFH